MIRSLYRSALCATLVGCASAPAAIAPRDVPTIVLDHGATELTPGMEWTNAMVELRDGRVLIGGHSKKIWLVDFRRDVRTVVADSGSGPTQIEDATLLSGPADSALVFDARLRRLLVFTPTGNVDGIRPFGGTEGNPFSVLKAMRPRSVDLGGEIFGESPGVGTASMAEMMGGTMTKVRDSVVIERFNPATGRTDSVARIRNRFVGFPQRKLVGNVWTEKWSVSDMRASDEWAALPDGRVAILRDGKYQVEFAVPGSTTIHGPAIAHPEVPLTDEEKKAAVESVRNDMADYKAYRARANGRADSAAPKEVYELAEPASWPATKAAYDELLASPDGRLWVMTPTAFEDKAFSYDVLDGTGALIAHIRTAPNEAIVGLGRGTVYTFRADTTELEHLRRYVLPPPIAPGR